MAPIATQNGDGVAEQTQVNLLKGGIGAYKEQAGGAAQYNKKLEEEGDANRPKAQVMSISELAKRVLTDMTVHQLPSDMGSRAEVPTIGAIQSY